MSNHKPQENTGRVVGLAIALAAFVIGLGLAADLHAKLSGAELAALAAFAGLFAIATYALDRGVRQWIDGWVRPGAATSPAASPAATSAPRTSVRGADAGRAARAG